MPHYQILIYSLSVPIHETLVECFLPLVFGGGDLLIGSDGLVIDGGVLVIGSSGLVTGGSGLDIDGSGFWRLGHFQNAQKFTLLRVRALAFYFDRMRVGNFSPFFYDVLMMTRRTS